MLKICSTHTLVHVWLRLLPCASLPAGLNNSSLFNYSLPNWRSSHCEVLCMLCLLNALPTYLNENIFLICSPQLTQRDLKTVIVIFPLLILDIPFCTMVIELNIDVVLLFLSVNILNLTGGWESCLEPS